MDRRPRRDCRLVGVGRPEHRRRRPARPARPRANSSTASAAMTTRSALLVDVASRSLVVDGQQRDWQPEQRTRRGGSAMRWKMSGVNDAEPRAELAERRRRASRLQAIVAQLARERCAARWRGSRPSTTCATSRAPVPDARRGRPVHPVYPESRPGSGRARRASSSATPSSRSSRTSFPIGRCHGRRSCPTCGDCSGTSTLCCSRFCRRTAAVHFK